MRLFLTGILLIFPPALLAWGLAFGGPAHGATQRDDWSAGKRRGTTITCGNAYNTADDGTTILGITGC